VGTLFELWDALGRADDIDPTELRQVRRRWLRRSFTVLAQRSHRSARRDRRFVAELLRRDALAPVTWVGRDLPSKVVSRARGRVRPQEA
jgi:hypothetical protein